MYLHDDTNLFLKVIHSVSDSLKILDAVVEKDYYVT